MTTLADGSRLYTPRVFNSTTKQRFLRDRWRRLVAHVGGHPTDTQQILIGRLVELEWTVARLTARQDAGELTEHSARMHMAAHNHIRLLTRELGVQAPTRKQPSIHDIRARRQAGA